MTFHPSTGLRVNGERGTKIVGEAASMLSQSKPECFFGCPARYNAFLNRKQGSSNQSK